MAGRLAEVLTRRPRAALATGLVLLAATAVLAAGAAERLAPGAIALEPGPAPDQLVIVLGPTPAAPARSAVFDVAAGVVVARLEADPDVLGVRRDRRAGELRLEAALAGDRGARLATVRRLEAELDPGPLRASFAGQIAELDRRRAAVGAELWRPALVALPLVALVGAWVLGSWLAAAALAATALGVTGCAACLRLLDAPADVSSLGLAAGGAVALVFAFEAAGLLAARAREARAIGAGAEAPLLAVSEWLAPACAAAVAAGVAPLALAGAAADQAPSLAAGAALAALLALTGVALLGPAALRAGRDARQARAGGGERPGRARLVLALAWLALPVIGLVLLAGALLARPPAGPGSLAPSSAAEAGALTAALGALVAVSALRTAIMAAVWVQEARAWGRLPGLLWRGSVASSAALVALAGALALLPRLLGAGEVPELELYGLLLAAGVALDAVLVRLPLLAIAGHGGRRGAPASG